jgi:hypothetical protein
MGRHVSGMHFSEFGLSLVYTPVEPVLVEQIDLPPLLMMLVLALGQR